MSISRLHIGIVSANEPRTRVLRKLLSAYSSHIVDWDSADPAALLVRNSLTAPNLILVDISCPDIDGVAITRLVLDNYDSEVLLFSSSVSHDASKVFEAMGYGALDVISLPDDHSCNSTEIEALIKKISNVGKLVQPKSRQQRLDTERKPDKAIKTADHLIAIGSSTGGPTALVKVLEKLPAQLNAAIVIIQHVDFQFSETLANWLNEQVELPVRIAREGDVPEPGQVLLAATNDHLCMRPDMSLAYQVEPANYSYRPSVDVFFKSVTEYWQRDLMGILLTGMGRDGAIGLRTMYDKGVYTIAQDQQSSVVFGMPKAAIELNAACSVLDIDNIGKDILEHLSPSPKNRKCSG